MLSGESVAARSPARCFVAVTAQSHRRTAATKNTLSPTTIRLVMTMRLRPVTSFPSRSKNRIPEPGDRKSEPCASLLHTQTCRLRPSKVSEMILPIHTATSYVMCPVLRPIPYISQQAGERYCPPVLTWNGLRKPVSTGECILDAPGHRHPSSSVLTERSVVPAGAWRLTLGSISRASRFQSDTRSRRPVRDASWTVSTSDAPRHQGTDGDGLKISTVSD